MSAQYNDLSVSSSSSHHSSSQSFLSSSSISSSHPPIHQAPPLPGHDTWDPAVPETLRPMFIQQMIQGLNLPDSLDPWHRLVLIRERYRELLRLRCHPVVPLSVDDISVTTIMTPPDIERDEQLNVQYLVDDYYDHQYYSREQWCESDYAKFEDSFRLDHSRNSEVFPYEVSDFKDSQDGCSYASSDMVQLHCDEIIEWNQYIFELLQEDDDYDADTLLVLANQNFPVIITDLPTYHEYQRLGTPNILYNSHCTPQELLAIYQIVDPYDVWTDEVVSRQPTSMIRKRSYGEMMLESSDSSKVVSDGMVETDNLPMLNTFIETASGLSQEYNTKEEVNNLCETLSKDMPAVKLYGVPASTPSSRVEGTESYNLGQSSIRRNIP